MPRILNRIGDPSQGSDVPAMGQYRLHQRYRNIGLACGAGFALMGLVSTYVAYFNVDGSFPRPAMAAAAFGCFWSGWILLAAWLLLAYRHYRLWIDDDSVRQIGVIRDDTLTFRWIEELKWRRYPAGGSVRVAGRGVKFTIELGNFAKWERDRITDRLRSSVESSRQVGWAEFQRQFADSPDKRNRAQRSQRIFFAIFVAHAIVFGVAGLIGLGATFLVGAIVNGAMAYRLYRRGVRAGDPTQPAV